VHTECWWGHLREGLFLRTKYRWDDNIEIDLQGKRWSRYIPGLFWWKIEKITGYFEHGNEHLVFKKCGEILDQLRKCQFLRRTLLHRDSQLLIVKQEA
jgi:hypothetical protein